MVKVKAWITYGFTYWISVFSWNETLVTFWFGTSQSPSNVVSFGPIIVPAENRIYVKICKHEYIFEGVGPEKGLKIWPLTDLKVTQHEKKMSHQTRSLQNAPMWSAVFPAAAHKFTPQPPLDKKVAYLKAIWQTDCCTMQLLNE